LVGEIVACCAWALDIGCGGSDCPEISAARPCRFLGSQAMEKKSETYPLVDNQFNPDKSVQY
jgi:hypothetical protein